MKYNYTIVVGAKEETENSVTIRNIGNKFMSNADALAFFLDEVNTYKAPENTAPQVDAEKAARLLEKGRAPVKDKSGNKQQKQGKKQGGGKKQDGKKQDAEKKQEAEKK